MSLKISFTGTSKSKADTAVVTIGGKSTLSASAQRLDKACGGLISHYLKGQDKFTGEGGQIVSLAAPKGAGYVRVILLGADKKENPRKAEETGGKVAAALDASGASSVHVYLDDMTAEDAAHFAVGLQLRHYRFDKYKGKYKGAKKQKHPVLSKIEILTGKAAKAKKIHDPLAASVAGTFLARDLVNEPPNILYPESFARIVQRELGPLGVKVEVFDEKKMTKLGFKAHLSVGQGSIRPSRVVVMRWHGGKKTPAKGKKKGPGPLAFVGKGVTFDTGGINLKPGDGMADMKMDMGGAAAVVGLMKTLALRKSKADVVGVIGLTENMPSDRAYRPSDIIGSLSGKTIEVLNTDAEGRLVLADALTYVQKNYDPRFVINLATLTGAILVALGHEYCGTFANDDKLWTNMSAASRETGEKIWRMPLDPVFKKDMEGTISDLRNLGSTGRWGGACTAAGFLEHFIDEGRPWAHMDIAGTAYIVRDLPTCPKPATGFGVRILNRLVADHYE